MSKTYTVSGYWKFNTRITAGYFNGSPQTVKVWCSLNGTYYNGATAKFTDYVSAVELTVGSHTVYGDEGSSFAGLMEENDASSAGRISFGTEPQEVSEGFYNWLNANAFQYALSGAWVWNSLPAYSVSLVVPDINIEVFSAHPDSTRNTIEQYYGIQITATDETFVDDGGTKTRAYVEYLKSDGSYENANIKYSGQSGWVINRKIYFGPTKQPVPIIFYDWFVKNAKPEETVTIKGDWLWNDIPILDSGRDRMMGVVQGGFSSNGFIQDTIFISNPGRTTIEYRSWGDAYTEHEFYGPEGWYNESSKTISFGPLGRTISLDFYEWFINNATPVVGPRKISGRWQLNEALEFPNSDFSQEFVYCNSYFDGTYYQKAEARLTGRTPDHITLTVEGVDLVLKNAEGECDFSKLVDRTIFFGPEEQYVSAEFYEWMIKNAAPTDITPIWGPMRWNSTLSITDVQTHSVTFGSADAVFTSIETKIVDGAFNLYYNDTLVYKGGAWISEAYQHINFSTLYQPIPVYFYDWIMANAEREEIDGYFIQEETLIGIANAIRAKTGRTAKIKVDDYVVEIESIPQTTGGGDPVLQEKTVDPQSLAQKVTPDEGYDGLSMVIVNAVPTEEIKLQAKTVDPTTQAQLITPDEGYDGLSMVTVNAASVEELIVLQEKDVTPSSGLQPITADFGYTALSKVRVLPVPTEEPEINQNGEYTPSDGKYFSKVVVNVPDTGAIHTAGFDDETCSFVGVWRITTLSSLDAMTSGQMTHSFKFYGYVDGVYKNGVDASFYDTISGPFLVRVEGVDVYELIPGSGVTINKLTDNIVGFGPTPQTFETNCYSCLKSGMEKIF